MSLSGKKDKKKRQSSKRDNFADLKAAFGKFKEKELSGSPLKRAPSNLKKMTKPKIVKTNIKKIKEVRVEKPAPKRVKKQPSIKKVKAEVIEPKKEEEIITKSKIMYYPKIKGKGRDWEQYYAKKREKMTDHELELMGKELGSYNQAVKSFTGAYSGAGAPPSQIASSSIRALKKWGATWDNIRDIEKWYREELKRRTSQIEKPKEEKVVELKKEEKKVVETKEVKYDYSDSKYFQEMREEEEKRVRNQYEIQYERYEEKLRDDDLEGLIYIVADIGNNKFWANQYVDNDIMDRVDNLVKKRIETAPLGRLENDYSELRSEFNRVLNDEDKYFDDALGKSGKELLLSRLTKEMKAIEKKRAGSLKLLSDSMSDSTKKELGKTLQYAMNKPGERTEIMVENGTLYILNIDKDRAAVSVTEFNLGVKVDFPVNGYNGIIFNNILKTLKDEPFRIDFGLDDSIGVTTLDGKTKYRLQSDYLFKTSSSFMNRVIKTLPTLTPEKYDKIQTKDLRKIAKEGEKSEYSKRKTIELYGNTYNGNLITELIPNINRDAEIGVAKDHLIVRTKNNNSTTIFGFAPILRRKTAGEEV